MSGPLVEIRNLHFAWPGGVQALRGLDLDMAAGEALALVGPNGAGKSTTLLALLGFIRPQAGSCRVGGLEVEPRNYREIRRLVGALFQDPDDQLFMPTLAEDVAFGPANLGLPEAEIRRRVEAALETVGLAGLGARPPHQLSGGEKRRAALATVLSMDPALLVLDEPAANLDPRARRRLIQWLQASSLARLLITHDLEMVLDLCPRTVLLDQGRVVADGPSLELLRQDALMEAHGLEVPWSLRAGHLHRLPLGEGHHARHHAEGRPHHHPWPGPDSGASG